MSPSLLFRRVLNLISNQSKKRLASTSSIWLNFSSTFSIISLYLIFSIIFLPPLFLRDTYNFLLSFLRIRNSLQKVVRKLLTLLLAYLHMQGNNWGVDNEVQRLHHNPCTKQLF